MQVTYSISCMCEQCVPDAPCYFSGCLGMRLVIFVKSEYSCSSELNGLKIRFSCISWCTVVYPYVGMAPKKMVATLKVHK